METSTRSSRPIAAVTRLFVDIFKVSAAFAAFAFLPMSVAAQSVSPAPPAPSALPVIRATSKRVSIRDGEYFDKNSWNLSPTAKPDVFTADRTHQTKWITFYTDIDSFRVKLKPGKSIDFIILYNGTDSCYTRIESAIPATAPPPASDTIPFELTSYNAIKIRTIINDIDTINMHLDISAFGWHYIKSILPNHPALSKVTRLQIGSAIFNNPIVDPTGVTAHEMDGRIGYNVFEGKIIQIDYDQNRIVIGTQLPRDRKGYTRWPLDFIRSFACIKGSFVIGNRNYTGEFLLDNGSDRAMLVDSSWAGSQGFPTDLPLIKTGTIRDPRGIKYETRIVSAPFFKISHFTLTDIPTLLLTGKNPVALPLNYLGNDLLKRFNMIVDLQHDIVYLKPNKLYHDSWHG